MNRVLIRKADGYPIESQSGSAPLGTLKQNAIRSGAYQESEIEEKYIEDSELKMLFVDKVHQPAEDQKRLEVQQAWERIGKLGFTVEDLRDIKLVLSSLDSVSGSREG